jgi:S-adenosylmethionine:tRNA ribosyltransferase-isomerase
MSNKIPYSYELPDERIAQRPVYPPDSAKMLVVFRELNQLHNSTFASIADYLKRGDILVFNDTRVIPARLFGRLDDPDQGLPIEIVLVEETSLGEWSALGFPMRKIRAAKEIFFSPELSATVLPTAATEDRVRLKFKGESFGVEVQSAITALIYKHGTMPIPPYIRGGRGDDMDLHDYQSILAKHEGSIAAPTASLHFTAELLEDIRKVTGEAIEKVTLHVGTASFQPIYVNGVLRRPAEERFCVSPDTLKRLTEQKAKGGRVIAVGTTVVRALESAVRSDKVSKDLAQTGLFIEPGFEFKIVDGLITNFHQPRTTHLLLVEALIGGALIDASYRSALSNNYRFLSYGDGMLIL